MQKNYKKKESKIEKEKKNGRLDSSNICNFYFTELMIWLTQPNLN